MWLVWIFMNQWVQSFLTTVHTTCKRYPGDFKCVFIPGLGSAWVSFPCGPRSRWRSPRVQAMVQGTGVLWTYPRGGGLSASTTMPSPSRATTTLIRWSPSLPEVRCCDFDGVRDEGRIIEVCKCWRGLSKHYFWNWPLFWYLYTSFYVISD